MSKFASFRRPATIALALTLSLGLAACGDGGTTPTPTPTVTSVAVSTNDSDNQLTVGQTATATANVVVTDGAATTVTWSSSNTNVATVDANGVITAKAVGSADIIATSTVDTSKSSKVTIVVVAATTTPTLTTAKISFRPAGVAAPAGYTVNTGNAFDGTSGWVQEGTTNPLPMTDNTRFRDPADTTNVVQGLEARQYSQLQMQCGTPTSGDPCFSGTLTSGAFRYKVVNGKYSVTVSVGDADKRNTNSQYAIRVETTQAIAPFTPTPGQFKTGTVTVTVSDGFLDIDAIGGKNTKLNYVDITPAP